MNLERPGIASTNRKRSGAFSSLLDLILRDETALDGLAFAYSELGQAERRALAQAVVQDAQDPTAALAALLSVEEQPVARQRLAELLGCHGRLEQAAFLDGDQASGEVRLLQALPGLDAESLRIRWSGSKIEHIEIESRLEPQSAEPSTPIPEPVSVQEAVDTMTPLLWAHIRAGGRLPRGVERFARFFSLA